MVLPSFTNLCNRGDSETCASSFSPARSHDRPVWPGGRLCVRLFSNVGADGDVEHERRLYEDDGAATTARTKTLQGYVAGLHRGDGLCRANRTARCPADAGIV